MNIPNEYRVVSEGASLRANLRYSPGNAPKQYSGEMQNTRAHAGRRFTLAYNSFFFSFAFYKIRLKLFANKSFVIRFDLLDIHVTDKTIANRFASHPPPAELFVDNVYR